MKLIDKSALVAEIEKKKEKYWKRGEESDALQDGNAKYWGGVLSCLSEVTTLINTLGVREVDLEKEIDNYISNNFFGSQTMGFFANRTKEEPNDEDIAIVAKHFFELGLSVNNPITAADRGMAEEIIINLKRVAQDYKIDLTKEIEWLGNQVRKGE